MPVDKNALLKDLQRQVKLLEKDLRERVKDVPEIGEQLKVEHADARAADRTAESFVAWRDATLTQAAAAWVLACTFVRFLEDNELIDEPLIAGSGERGELAAERRANHFRVKHDETDRDYLYDCFRTVAALPGMASLYDERHNPIWRLGISGDAAKELIQFWRARVPETGELVHDFTDPEWDTRFLGDLYQDLSESVRKRYALLQTPDFIEEFILERTLLPALDEFGLEETRMIDPTCGSGHFLLGGFGILLDRWQKKEPGSGERKLVQRALDGVYGVDINPYATAIARFRLVIAALRESNITKLMLAPAYEINVTTGDSLLHGKRMLTAADALSASGTGRGDLGLDGESEQMARMSEFSHAYYSEDLVELNRILGQQYHAVVGNPPYITVSDSALSKLYRKRYPRTCFKQYSLAVVFVERFWQLAEESAGSSGFVGLITSNSFMKREFGARIIEAFFPRVDLTHLLDLSGAYIPGHGTPTVLLLGRDREPVGNRMRVVYGLAGEPSVPENPSSGLVWSAAKGHVDLPDSETRWVSVVDAKREHFSEFPWVMGGPGAGELYRSLSVESILLGEVVQEIGRTTHTGEDDAFVYPDHALEIRGLGVYSAPFVGGEAVRDYSVDPEARCLMPYSSHDGVALSELPNELKRELWSSRSSLRLRKDFGRTVEQRGLAWYEHSMFFKRRYMSPLSIAFAFVATHNHFVLDRGGKVFNRTAPVIKLSEDATEADHLSLLGLLNSSTACFWMKQVFHNKGDSTDSKGARVTSIDSFANSFEFTGTGLKKFPLPTTRPTALATQLDRLANERQSHLPAQLVDELPISRETFDEHCAEAQSLLPQMLMLQEELDWQCYHLYGVTGEVLCIPDLIGEDNPEPVDVPGIDLGERAFEIIMARRMAAGKLETTWFERHGSTPITELPDRWPQPYRELVERRIALIESDRNIRLLEQPEYKRRWNQDSWEEQEKKALRSWLLDRLETERYWPDVSLQTVRALGEAAEHDEDFRQVAELLEGRPDIDFFPLVASLVKDESVPFLAALRYKASGLDKREEWERTWTLQREEDAIDAEVAGGFERLPDEDDETFKARLLAEQRRVRTERIGPIPAPPKYKQADFVDAVCWRLRGALDVPKERFVSYPHCAPSANDGQLVGWAGWDHLGQATALATHVDALANEHGWEPEQMKPALAGLVELMPWLRQWHHEVDPTYNQRMDEYLAQVLAGELHRHGLTEADVRAWKPPARTRGKRRARAA